MAHACNSSTQEVEDQKLNITFSYTVQSETLCQKQNKANMGKKRSEEGGKGSKKKKLAAQTLVSEIKLLNRHPLYTSLPLSWS